MDGIYADLCVRIYFVRIAAAIIFDRRSIFVVVVAIFQNVRADWSHEYRAQVALLLQAFRRL